MNSDSLNSYLEAQVLTATPQKQRLMLIEGAMRFMRQAVQAWEDDQYEQASAALSSSRKIVAELISSIRIQEGELTQRVAAIYVFVFQTITAAQLERSAAKIHEALEVLAVDRETWQMLCEQMPEAPAPSNEQRIDGPQEILAPKSATLQDAAASRSSFSFEA